MNDVDDELDRRIVALLTRAGADVPDPELIERRSIPSEWLPRRRRLVLFAAVALAVVGACATWLAVTREPVRAPADRPDVATSTTVVTDSPTPTSELATTTSSEVVSSTSAPPPTAVPVVRPLFTPVAVGTPPAGYVLVWARVDRIGGGDTGFVRYAASDGGPGLLLIVRATPDFFVTALGLGRSTWQVNGRTVVDDSQGGGCTVDGGCSVGVQWDDRTAVSVSWDGDSLSLDADHTQDSLVDVVASMTEVPAEFFTVGPLFSDTYVYDVTDPYEQAPLTIAGTQAGTPYVSTDHGDGPVGVASVTARIALRLPDGRVLIDPADGSPELIEDPQRQVPIGGEPPQPVVLWPERDRTDDLRLHDVAVIDGRTWILTTTQPDSCDPTCTLTVLLAPIDDPSGDGATVELPEAGGSADASLRLTMSDSGAIVGVLAGEDPQTVELSFDGERISPAAVRNLSDREASYLAIERTGQIAAALTGQSITVINLDTGEERHLELPTELAVNVIGIDVSVSMFPWDRGIVAVSRSTGPPLIVDLDDESISLKPPETTGLATMA